MASQTVTTNVNYDDASISGLTDGDSITINGGSVTINSDVRWNQQSAVFGSITTSSTLGGNFYIDGRDVWELTFTASTGNVPAQAALGSNGIAGGTSLATGELLRVWATGSLTPSAAGGAMPATGWIKLRSKTGTFQNGEIVTLPGGATITINGPGKRSWINVVMREGYIVTWARLNTFWIKGDWYDLGTTSGLADQTIQYPIADYCPAIQIETAAGSGVYEWWLNGGERWGTATQFIDTDARGKWFSINATTGVITLAQRTGATCGMIAPAGCKIRVPNVLCSNAAATNYAVNTFNSSTALRGVLNSTSSGGLLDFNCCVVNWRVIVTSLYSVSLTNTCIGHQASFTTTTTTTNINNVAIGPYPTGGVAGGLTINSSSDGTLTDVRAGHLIVGLVLSISNGSNFTCTRIQADQFGASGSQERASGNVSVMTLTAVTNATMTDCSGIMGQFAIQSCQNVSIKNYKYADRQYGSTLSTVAVVAAIYIFTKCDTIVIDGFGNFAGLADVHPYSYAVATTNLVTNVTVKNIGTSISPYNCGSANQMSGLANFAITTYAKIYDCYASNNRAAIVAASSSSSNVIVQNVYGNYARVFNAFVGINSTVRATVADPTTSANAAQYGTHWLDGFTAATTGIVQIVGNEPTSQTLDQCTYSFTGNSTFNGAGSVLLLNVNDYCEWTTPYFILGYTAFQNVAPSVNGTNVATNHAITFQYNTGSGWNGTYLTLNAANLSAISFNATTGIKLKVRTTCTVANAANAITYIRLAMSTTATDQLTKYASPNDGVGTVTNLQIGSRVQIYNQTTAIELYNVVATSSSVVYNYLVGNQISNGDTIRIRIAKLGYYPTTLLAIAGFSTFTATALQSVDSIYVFNGIDGSTVTEFSADYPNIQMDIADPDGITTVQRIYAWLRYNETTSNGIAQWFNAVTPTDAVNYLIDTTILNMQLDNRNATPVQIIGGRIYRSDNATIIAPLSNSIQMDPFRVYLTDGITTTQATYNNLADTFLRRSTANIEVSTFGDPLTLRSMYGMVSQGTHNTYVNDKTNKLIVTKSNDTTILGTRSISQSPNAQPITGLDSD